MPSKEWREANPEKMRQYRREWYRRNKKHAVAKSVKRRKELQKWLKEYKATLSCMNCGEDHPACIVFHHRDPSKKDATIAHIVYQKGWGRKRIMEEINKCDVLCANCHRKEHARLI